MHVREDFQLVLIACFVKKHDFVDIRDVIASFRRAYRRAVARRAYVQAYIGEKTTGWNLVVPVYEFWIYHGPVFRQEPAFVFLAEYFRIGA